MVWGEASRLGYPSELVDFMLTTAGIGAGSKVLEVRCGTGQLTQQLASHGFDLTASLRYGHRDRGRPSLRGSGEEVVEPLLQDSAFPQWRPRLQREDADDPCRPVVEMAARLALSA